MKIHLLFISPFCFILLFSLNTFPEYKISPGIPADSLLPNTNLIVNGDFESGNRDFESEYQYMTDTLYHGHYTVTSDISAMNCFLKSPDRGDHTSGHGQYMVVDSKIFRSTVRSKVWISNSFKVKPHTDYIFSAWVYPVGGSGGSSPKLEVTIHGKPIGKAFMLSKNSEKWEHIYYTWNSGKIRGNVTVSIENLYYYQYIEDFAIDDIYFGVK